MSRTWRRVPLAARALVLLVVAIGATFVIVTQRDVAASGGRALGPGPVTVQLDVEHSRFRPTTLRVRAHTEVRFVVVNHDPIGHELIVGDGRLHARHAQGTEPWHPPRPGEVSVGANARASTTYVFHEPGTVVYACHLPGHFEFGMHGRVVVTGLSRTDAGA
jgi:uncharacterized cupredoxin-like copper-binding protein